MNIKWHYWCGYRQKTDRYIKYLLVSVSSLVTIGKVRPEDIYITLDAAFADHSCTVALQKLGVNLLAAPVYANYSKQIAYHRLLQQVPDIDTLVQIDCDTLVTDERIIQKIAALQGCVHVDRSGDLTLYNIIQRRDGQKQRGNGLFSVGNVDSNPPHSNNKPAQYVALKDYLQLLYGVNLDSWIEQSKNEKLPVGFLYVLKPKQLPTKFFDFLAQLNFFFEDDEMALIFAKFFFGLTFNSVNSDAVNRANPVNVIFATSSVADLNRYSGIVHFPPDTSELMVFVEQQIAKILA